MPLPKFTQFPFETNEPKVEVTLPVGRHVLELVVEDSAGLRSAPATVVITVQKAEQVAVTIDPTTGSVITGETQQFKATVTGATNTAVTWSVAEGAAGGTIDKTGLYTAPPTTGTFHVVAASVADKTKSASATVTVKGIPCIAGRPDSPICTGARPEPVCIAGKPDVPCTGGQPEVLCVVGGPSSPCTGARPEVVCVVGGPSTPCTGGKPEIIACVAGKPDAPCTGGQPEVLCVVGGPSTPCTGAKPEIIACVAGKPEVALCTGARPEGTIVRPIPAKPKVQPKKSPKPKSKPAGKPKK